MELLHLYELLVEAFDAVEANKRDRALFKLNRIIDILEKDYVMLNSCWAVTLDNMSAISRLYWLRHHDKHLALTSLDNAIDLCESWIECKRSA